MKEHFPAIVCESEILSQITTIQTLGKMGIPVVAISNDKNAVGLFSKYPHKKVVSPMPHYDSSFVNFLIENVEPGVIFYGGDSNAELISKNQSVLRDNGFFVHISDYATHIGLYDKYELSTAAENAGVGYPLSILIQNERELEKTSEIIHFPFILKPTKGAGGFYFLINNREELETKYFELSETLKSSSYCHSDSRIIAQEFLNTNNQELWNYNAFYADGQPLGEFVGLRKRTPVRPDGRLGSSLLYGVSKSNEELNKQNQKLLSLIKYDGFVETEWVYIKSKTEYILFDVNARPSGNIKWAIIGGVNLPYLYYRYCLGNVPEIVQLQKDSVTYHKMFWFNIDLLDALRGRLMAGETKYSVFKSNLRALITPDKSAIDVLDFNDLKPTFTIIKRFFFLVLMFFKRKLLKG